MPFPAELSSDGHPYVACRIDTLGLEGLLNFTSGKNISIAILCISAGLNASVPSTAQQDTSPAIIQRIDASVHARENNLLGYTVTEHYAVFRNHDEQHPAADMVVKTTYQKDVGKNYTVVSEGGSEILRKVLESVLDHERRMTRPANRVTAVITPANYEMAVQGIETVEGRNCVALSLKPRRVSQYLLNGTVWVDAQDGSIVQLQGVTAKSPSVFTGASQVFRQYASLEGFPMAMHARAVSNSWLAGETIIKIDYTDYQLQLRAAR
jgi:outer membrane lipoprotein-sorting protein